MTDLHRFQELFLFGDGHHVVMVDQFRDGNGRHPTKTVVMDPRAQRHQELAIEPVGNAAVSRNDRIEILDPVRSFDRRRQKSTERCHDTRKQSQPQRVDLDRDHIPYDQFEMMELMRRFTRYTPCQFQRNSSIGCTRPNNAISNWIG